VNFSLRPDLEKLVNEKVQTGQYRSPDDVLNAALDLLRERDEAERRLEQLLQEGEESGPATEMKSDDWAEIEREGLRRLNSRKSA
jgi:antitoxin ParD1/3/4